MNLSMLRCQDNQLTSLDVSSSVDLRYLECTNNRLTSLNVKNGSNTIIYHLR